MIVLRYLDLVLLAVALPVFIAAGWPLLGWAAGAAAWIVQRAIQHYTNRKAVETDDLKATAGWITGSMIGRGWLCAITIFAAGMVENDAGLAAAVLVIACFTAYFTVSMILRPFEQTPTGQPSS
jgi:hypothetical protein